MLCRPDHPESSTVLASTSIQKKCSPQRLSIFRNQINYLSNENHTFGPPKSFKKVLCKEYLEKLIVVLRVIATTLNQTFEMPQNVQNLTILFIRRGQNARTIIQKTCSSYREFQRQNMNAKIASTTE